MAGAGARAVEAVCLDSSSGVPDVDGGCLIVSSGAGQDETARFIFRIAVRNGRFSARNVEAACLIVSSGAGGVEAVCFVISLGVGRDEAVCFLMSIGVRGNQAACAIAGSGAGKDEAACFISRIAVRNDGFDARNVEAACFIIGSGVGGVEAARFIVSSGAGGDEAACFIMSTGVRGDEAVCFISSSGAVKDEAACFIVSFGVRNDSFGVGNVEGGCFIAGFDARNAEAAVLTFATSGRCGIIRGMPDDQKDSPALPEVRFASHSATPLTVFDASTPLPIPPEMLTEGLRELQLRLPMHHFSAEETRSRMRVAYLDPEFVENGLLTATHWPQAKIVLGSTGEELRAESEEIARWDLSIKELRVVLEGMEGANLERKYRLNEKILLLYSILKTTITHPANRRLRPYLEAMKRAYSRNRRKPGPAAKAAAEAMPQKSDER